MSGIEEQVIYPPQCECGQCYEWYLGKGHWMLPEEAMKQRKLPYPVIVMDDGDGALMDLKIRSVTCVKCGHVYLGASKIGEQVITAFNTYKGRKYIKSLVGQIYSDKWYFGESVIIDDT